MEYNFKKIDNLIPTPKLTEIQENSYKKFLSEGIAGLLKEISPIVDYNDNLYLHLNEYRIIPSAISDIECIKRKQTYAFTIQLKCCLVNKLTKSVIEQEVYFGDYPQMTQDKTFIINGTQKVIVTQIVRSPGIYYTKDESNVSYDIIKGLLMPYNGAWMELENDINDFIYIILDKKKKIYITTFLRSLGCSEDEIRDIIGIKIYEKMMEKDKWLTLDEAAEEVFKKIRPGELATLENAKNIVNYLFYSSERYNLKEVGRYKLNKKTGLNIPLDVTVLTKEDIIAYIKGYLKALYREVSLDNIDHLANRRLKLIGEILEEKFRIGLYKTSKNIVEKMSMKDTDEITPQNIIHPKILKNTVREFFLINQLSQMMESTNPLSEITNKRRVSAIGKGGLNKDRAGFQVRDVHYTHYGRLCPIETPEGANIGLITSLAEFADVDKYGFITTPYRKIDKKNKKLLNEVDYLNAEDEDNYYIAQININVDDKGNILDKEVLARHKGETVLTSVEDIDYIDISPQQILSLSASIIPFVHHDDTTRAAMGCNMQRQAVPLIKAESPWVGTGTESLIGKEYTKFSEYNGTVISVDCNEIKLKIDNTEEIKTYSLVNFFGTKKETCIREYPIVKVGQKIKIGDKLYYRYSIDRTNGKLALGRNILVAYMPWNGYNYEDSVLLSRRLIKEDYYTSIHIEKYEVDIRETKLGKEEFTNDVPNIPKVQKDHLGEDGIIKIGTRVKAGDYLVGKITPKGKREPTPEERLYDSVYGHSSRQVKDTSFKVPNGDWGVIIDVIHFTKEDNPDLSAGVLESVHVYIAKKRKIDVGDKMAGRHGNKGVVSLILPEWEMPYLPDGTPVDIVLNPMGVPSRMNIGQILETHLGWAAKILGCEYIIPAFDGPNIESDENDITEELKKAKLPLSGKTVLYDGRTGKPFDSKVTVGYAYMLKLHHLVDEKSHARSTGSYSAITQQPLGGKSQFGGQRFGEMEVWALEGYGAAYTLQEMLTLKSDDVDGRDKTVKNILCGEEPPEPGIPESFKVLERSLKALCMDFIVNGEDDVVETAKEDLVEQRFLPDAELLSKITPFKLPKNKNSSEDTVKDNKDNLKNNLENNQDEKESKDNLNNNSKNSSEDTD